MSETGCLRPNCGHARRLHAGEAGYCHDGGCSCEGFLRAAPVVAPPGKPTRETCGNPVRLDGEYTVRCELKPDHYGNHGADFAGEWQSWRNRSTCRSVMRDTTPPGRFVCGLHSGHDGPHYAPLADGGLSVWSDDGAVPAAPLSTLPAGYRGAGYSSSVSYGDLPPAIRALVISHEWDNLTPSEQRDWLIERFDTALSRLSSLERELGAVRSERDGVT
jgi:hypothetical protein